jgi:hypothetical protein
MTSIRPLPLAEITRRAIKMLSQELGPADTVRFMAQFSGGSGDYTTERATLFAGRTVAELAAEIRAAVAAPGAAADRGNGVGLPGC